MRALVQSNWKSSLIKSYLSYAFTWNTDYKLLLKHTKHILNNVLSQQFALNNGFSGGPYKRALLMGS